jgi:hypothetical protein
MSLSLSLFDLDGFDGLIEQSMPWFALWLIALAIGLAIVVTFRCVERVRHRSPVDRLLRQGKRFG